MNHHSLDQLALLHDQARARAVALRQQAQQDFWHSALSLLGQGLGRAERAAQRLAYRLQRHRQLRQRADAVNREAREAN